MAVILDLNELTLQQNIIHTHIRLECCIVCAIFHSKILIFVYKYIQQYLFTKQWNDKYYLMYCALAVPITLCCVKTTQTF